MADYPVRFLTVIPWPAGVDACAQAAFHAAYHAACADVERRSSPQEDYDLCCRGVAVECLPHGWAIGDDAGEGQLTAAVYATRFFLRHFQLTAAVLLEWSCSASTPEPGAYHGGAVLVTAADEHWIDPGRLALQAAQQRGWALL